MSILITINHMVNFGGSEKYVLALVEGLVTLGQTVFLFANQRGKSFDFAISIGAHPYTEQEVDLILLNHNSTFKHLSRRNKQLPIFQICHGIFPYLEQPVSNLDGYFAVSPEVQGFLQRGGIESILLWNPVVHRNERPKNIHDIDFLILSQGGEAVEILKHALGSDFVCIFGNKHSREIDHVDQLMRRTKVVVGTGRAVMEAAVNGCAAFGLDSRHYDGVKFIGPVRSNNWEALSYSNFSGRGFQEVLETSECRNLLLQTMSNWEEYSSEIQPLGMRQHHYMRTTEKILSSVQTRKKSFKLFRRNRIEDLRTSDEQAMWATKRQ